MRVVELDRNLLWKLVPICVVALEAAYEVGHRASDQEILLQKAESLAHCRGVVRIEHAGQRFCFESLAESSDKVAGTKFLEIEVVGRGRGPEPESVDRLSAVAHYGAIERYADQARRFTRNYVKCSVSQLEGTVQLDFHFLVRAGDLPRIAVPQPIVGVLLLPAVRDGLLEHTVLVAQTITRGGELHGGHRVEETSCQAAQTSISQTSIGLLFDQFKPIDAFLLNRLPGHGIKQQVRNIICQRTSKQKLHGKVINAFGIPLLIC